MICAAKPWRVFLICGLFAAALGVAPPAFAVRSTLMPAMQSDLAGHSPILALAQAGPRMVAAGARGIVLLSDDYGLSWRQARDVPTQAALTDLYFFDAQDGFAVGEDGVILETQDGGESWALRYVDMNRGLALFGIHFLSRDYGLAVGALGLMLETKNGGRNWSERLLRRFDYSDLNLNKVVSNDDVLYIASQFGVVYRSANHGASFEPVQSPSQTDFWSAQVMGDGSVVFGGANGEIWRARGDLTGWSEVDSQAKDGITALTLTLDGRLAATGLNGYLAVGSAPLESMTVLTGHESLLSIAPSAVIAGPRESLIVGGRLGLQQTPDR